MANLGTKNLGNNFNSVNIANTNATAHMLEELNFSEASNNELYREFTNTILLSAPQIKNEDGVSSDSSYYSLLVTDSSNNICDFTYINAIDDIELSLSKDNNTGEKRLQINTSYIATMKKVNELHNEVNTYAHSKPGIIVENNGEIFNIDDLTKKQNKWYAGKYAHSEGYHTKAYGNYSHAEGQCTYTGGENSHAEGYYTYTYTWSKYSHTEGYHTYTGGLSSHAEGQYTYATGGHSHAEGHYSYSLGDNSHAEGYYTRSFNDNCHAEGHSTYAIGVNSHAEGYKTIANGDNSHSEGNITYVAAFGGHAEGEFSFVEGQFGHAEGLGWGGPIIENHSSGTLTFTAYESNVLINSIGINNVVFSTKCNEFRYITDITRETKEGDVLNTYATITISSAFNNDITTIGDRLYISPIAKGYASHAEGQSGMAFGNFSHAEGQYSKADGLTSHSEGGFTIAKGNFSHAEGYLSQANGVQSHAGGYKCIAENNCSFAHGTELTTSNANEAAFGMYNSTSNGQLFSIGNGTFNSRQNMLTVTNNNIKLNITTSDLMLLKDKKISGNETISLEQLLNNKISEMISDALSNSETGIGEKFNTLILNSMPIGSIIMWSQSSLPSGGYWLMCNGAGVNQTNYPKLYSMMTTTPDLRDRFIVGAGSNKYTVNTKGGNETKTLSVAEMPAHRHNWFGDDQLVQFTSGWGGTFVQNYGKYDADSSIGHYDSRVYSTSQTGEGKSFSIIPPYYALYYIIKAK